MTTLRHRDDIDGLRAVAVLSVVLFHLNPALVPGGFAGVDIFFVISGFLLTSIIRRELLAERFSFWQFYARRIRRIVPALAAVVAATLLAGKFILLPEDYVELSKSAVASMLGVANIFFAYFVDTSYFAAASTTKPLLHIWSLGVEEQFYFVWPFIALFLVTTRRALSISVSVTVLLVVLSEWLLRSDPTFAYYMLPARAFELMIGATLANVYFRTKGVVTGNLIAISGLILIAFSLVWVDESVPFPGFAALPATVGTALIIFSSSDERTTIVARLLSIKPLVDIGKISYSLYLWHWPVVAFIYYIYSEISVPHGVLGLAVMLLLSIISYCYVEEPCRRVKLPLHATYSVQLFLPIALITAASLWVVSSGGRALSAPDYQQRLTALSEAAKPATMYPYVCQGFPLTIEMTKNPKCIINDVSKGEPGVLLWGDSHAAHYIGILGSVAKQLSFSFRNAQASSCPPVFRNPEQYTSPKYAAACRESGALFSELVQPYNTIFMGGLWTQYLAKPDFLPELEETVRSLVNSGKTVILLAQVPEMARFDRLCAQKSIKLDFLDCQGMAAYPLKAETEVNTQVRSLQKIGPNVHFLDVRSTICEEGICSAYRGNIPLYFDQSHLSMVGSWMVGKSFVKEPLPRFLRPLAGRD